MPTFRVDDVAIETSLLPTTTLAAMLPEQLHIGGDPSQRVLEGSGELWSLDGVHPLIGAVFVAFAKHRPLVLTPDAIWLTITQGVAQHVRDHADTLRSRLVRHARSKAAAIELDAEPASPADWGLAIDKLRAALAEDIGDGRAKRFECTFSTSTPTDLLASQVIFLDAWSPYYHYESKVVCGIPDITLLGTPADWREIQTRLDLLDELDLAHWSSRLRPIIREFVAASEGRPDIALWKRIYNPRDAYGGDHVCGWITRFYPTLFLGGKRVPNPMLRFEMDEPRRVAPSLLQKLFARKDSSTYAQERDGYGYKLDAFPNRLSRVSVRVSWPKHTSRQAHRVTLRAGLAAIAIDERGAVRPISGWAVSSGSALPEIAAIIAERFTVTPPIPKPRPGPFARFLPEEIEELATHIGQAALFSGTRTWRLRDRNSIDEIEPPGRYWMSGRYADLPDGESLCYWDALDGTHWFVCTLAEQDGKPRMIEPLDQITTYGESLRALLETALATDGDISAHAGPTLASYWDSNERARGEGDSLELMMMRSKKRSIARNGS